MENEQAPPGEPEGEPAPPEPPEPPPRPVGARRTGRAFKLVLLAAGLFVAAYLAKSGPHEQHVRVVLGDERWRVKALDLQYVAADGEVAREAHFAYAHPDAPRVVSHEPSLTDGTYLLRIEVDTREGRRAVERQVTLGGGSTQVDISRALAPAPQPDAKTP